VLFITGSAGKSICIDAGPSADVAASMTINDLESREERSCIGNFEKTLLIRV